MSGPGRDQVAPIERLARILFALSSARGRPVPIDRLVEAGGYGAESLPDRRDQLRRDIRHLLAAGWVISSDGPPSGDLARYRLVAVDTRLRVEFTAEERFQLLRAARVAQLHGLYDDLDDGPVPQTSGSFDQGTLPDLTDALEVVRWAAARRCLLRFSYKGLGRLAHPFAVHARQGGWYLTAREDGDTVVKTFAISRMLDVRTEAPGTSQPPDTPVGPQLDPLSWRVDPAVEAVVETSALHQPQVESMLGAPVSAGPGDDGPGLGERVDGGEEQRVVLVIPVTHRAAFLGRLYQLGPRVRLLGPEDLRAQMRADLLAVIDAAAPAGAATGAGAGAGAAAGAGDAGRAP